MKFVDEATIEVFAGNGGGAVSVSDAKNISPLVAPMVATVVMVVA